MNVEFVRFEATDDVELQGWLSNQAGEMAAIHIHGMSGNGYENHFLDNLRDMYNKNGITFFSINTRGHGIVSDFRQKDGYKRGGSCYEIFEECVHDIQGALNYLKTLGKRKFILQGHSLGCIKVVHFILNGNSEELEKIILLAPTDMAGWAATDPKHEEYLKTAKRLIGDGKCEELVGSQCWLDKTPLSAQTYPSISETGSHADIYSSREGGALLGRIIQPMLICYGTNDIGIERIDGSVENWLGRVNKTKHPNTRIAIIDGATHGFKSQEEKLADVVKSFLVSI